MGALIRWRLRTVRETPLPKRSPSCRCNFLDRLRLVLPADQGGIGRMNDDKIVATDRGDEVPRIA